MRQVLRAVVVGLFAGGILGTAAFAAHAMTYGTWSNFTSNSVGYRNQSGVDSASRAITVLQRLDHGQADPGKMGGKTRMYWSGGTLCAASVERLNDTPTTLWSLQINTNCGGLVYSRGYTMAWNGGGWYNLATDKSPTIGTL